MCYYMIVLVMTSFWIISILGQEKTQEMCNKYAKAVYQKRTDIFSWRHRGPLPKESTCALFENPLIIGGAPARHREFPHMAAIGYAPTEDSLDIEWLCGGSLISEKHVLTAAHCTLSRSGPPQKVRLGSISLTEKDDYVQEISVLRFVKHPKYKRPSKYNDIALLILKHAAKFSAFVRPACLNTFDEISEDKIVAIGFGRVSLDSPTTSQFLLKVDLDIIPRDTCNEIMKFRKSEMPLNITETMLCVGSLDGERDTCQGDSGGPLQIILDDPYCMYSIIGVTSFGRFCGMPYSPGIYTKVDQYIDWIERTIWN